MVLRYRAWLSMSSAPTLLPLSSLCRQHGPNPAGYVQKSKAVFPVPFSATILNVFGCCMPWALAPADCATATVLGFGSFPDLYLCTLRLWFVASSEEQPSNFTDLVRN